MRGFLLMLIFVSLSCGEKEEEETFDDKTLSLISSSSNLPTCNQGTAGKIVYVRDTDEFKFCESESWITIDIRGAAGIDGTNGADGMAGSQGPEGPAGPSGSFIGKSLYDVDGVEIGVITDHAISEGSSGSQSFSGQLIKVIKNNISTIYKLYNVTINPADSNGNTKSIIIPSLDSESANKKSMGRLILNSESFFKATKYYNDSSCTDPSFEYYDIPGGGRNTDLFFNDSTFYYLDGSNDIALDCTNLTSISPSYRKLYSSGISNCLSHNSGTITICTNIVQPRATFPDVILSGWTID